MEINVKKHEKEEIEELQEWYNDIPNEDKDALTFDFENEIFFSAEINGVRVGLMSIIDSGTSYGNLKRFIIKSNRHHSVAHEMLMFLIEEAKMAGKLRVKGVIRSEKTRGIEYFNENGFKIVKFGKVDGVDYHTVILRLRD